MKQPQLIKSLDKGLKILEIIGESETPVTISELSHLLGINKSSAFRLLNTLKSRGFVINAPNSKAFVLGAALRNLANKTQWVNALVQIAKIYLKQLTELTGETTHIAILDGNQTLIVANELSSQSIGVTIQKGDTAQIHCTSFGKSLVLDYSRADLVKLLGDGPLKSFTKNTLTSVDLLYEQLEKFKKLGYVIDNEEHVLGIRCIGIPIIDASGNIIAALGLSAPLDRLPKEKFDLMGNQVRYIGGLISEKLGADNLFPSHIAD